MAAIHDMFTLLCDARLRRKAAQWRWLNADRHRLMFLRRLAKHSGLLADNGEVTPLVTQWLELPLAEQSSFLIEAWITEKDEPVRRALWMRWQTLKVGETIKASELTQRESLARQRWFWLPLVWLGLTAARGKAASPELIRLSAPLWHESEDRSFPLWRV